MLYSMMLVLPLAIGVNILLGFAIAKTSFHYDKQLLLQGIFKATAIYAAIGGLVLIARVIPLIDVEGVGQIDILNALTIIVSSVLGVYIVQGLQKLTQALKLKIKVPVQTDVEHQAHGTE